MQNQLSIFGNEVPISLADARDFLPNRPDISTLFRWCTPGVRGITLEHVRIGKRIYTSREAVQRFITRTTEAETSGQLAPRMRKRSSPTSRERRIERAEAELQSTGFKGSEAA
jgi:hypothetical protein